MESRGRYSVGPAHSRCSMIVPAVPFRVSSARPATQFAAESSLFVFSRAMKSQKSSLLVRSREVCPYVAVSEHPKQRWRRCHSRPELYRWLPGRPQIRNATRQVPVPRSLARQFYARRFGQNYSVRGHTSANVKTSLPHLGFQGADCLLESTLPPLHRCNSTSSAKSAALTGSPEKDYDRRINSLSAAVNETEYQPTRKSEFRHLVTTDF